MQRKRFCRIVRLKRTHQDNELLPIMRSTFWNCLFKSDMSSCWQLWNSMSSGDTRFNLQTRTERSLNILKGRTSASLLCLKTNDCTMNWVPLVSFCSCPFSSVPWLSAAAESPCSPTCCGCRTSPSTWLDTESPLHLSRGRSLRWGRRFPAQHTRWWKPQWLQEWKKQLLDMLQRERWDKMLYKMLFFFFFFKLPPFLPVLVSITFSMVSLSSSCCSSPASPVISIRSSESVSKSCWSSL